MTHLLQDLHERARLDYPEAHIPAFNDSQPPVIIMSEKVCKTGAVNPSLNPNPV